MRISVTVHSIAPLEAEADDIRLKRRVIVPRAHQWSDG
jgi:hypothetical protein